MAEIRVTLEDLAKGVVLKTGESHTVVLIARVGRVRLVGMFFDLDKCFLLPSAMHGIRRIKSEYDAHPNSNLLIVGHTDTSGADDYNLILSVERADAMAAFLTDDVATWEGYFGTDKPSEKRWGAREVQNMLAALPEGGTPFYDGAPNGTEDAKHTAAVKQFQDAQGLAVDGIAGPITRHALIQAYMGLDGTTLPSGIAPTTHGCGENFPVDATGDGVRDPDNRRVEVFFFDGPIQPAPPGKTSPAGSTEYPQWLAQVTETVDISAEDPDPTSMRIRLHDDNATPLTDVQFKVAVSGQPDTTGTSADGFVTIQLPAACPATVTVSWGGPLADGSFLFSRDIFADCSEGASDEQSRAKLFNLGYPSGSDADFESAVKAFQRDYQTGEYGLVDGALPPATNSKLGSIYAGNLDATRPPPASPTQPDDDEDGEPPPVTLSMDCDL
jgi:hypothetical protein